jgi:hypothetical protein
MTAKVNHQHIKIKGKVFDLLKPDGGTAPRSMNKYNPLRRTWMKIGFVIEHERRRVLQNSRIKSPESKKTNLEIFQN